MPLNATKAAGDVQLMSTVDRKLLRGTWSITGGFVLNRLSRILAEGRPKTYTSRVAGEKLDQISRLGDSP